MNLSLANLSDLEVLNLSDTRPHVIAAAGEDDTLDWRTELPRRVRWREIRIAEIEGRPIGVLVIIEPAQEETHDWGDLEADLRAIDIWIGKEADLGPGYGTVMMRLALERCFANPKVKAVLIDPLVNNTRANRFYERLGFRRIERRRFGDDDCFVYRIDRPVEGWNDQRVHSHTSTADGDR